MIGGLRTRGVIKTGSKKNPLISIITVVFNGEKYLEQAILSVAQQTYKNIEYIIIDGGSKDKSTQIIKNHEDVIDFWISEKDKLPIIINLKMKFGSLNLELAKIN